VTWNDVNAIVLRILRRWWLVAGVLVLVVGASFWGLSGSLNRYETTTLMVVGPNPDLEPSEVLRVADLVGRNMTMSTYADVMASPKVVATGMVATDPTRSDWADYEVRVVQEPDSNVLRMIVRGPDAEMTATLTAEVQASGKATLAELFPIYAVSSLNAGEPQAYLVSLPWVRTIGIAVVIGLGLGVLLALWFDSLMAFRRNSIAVSGRSGVSSTVPGVDPQTAAYPRR
jgi:capsular polysaccharide biosynthesis protein